ncbi:IS1595 family transposase [Paenibacillus antri]|uniref:IS1595 family transposase n=1 Tax=Paenibacillus antri TaxID=2582848 RepID=A0A5R9FZU1_9BACL|nr:transposase [Paenibacillus antri]TLS49031.1 IS1595 family transposase [Paenibacillus antri]
MEQAELVALFFRRRWPNGFVCPSCGHGAYYTISTRQLPLYECRLCGHQTSVTAGTVMAKTRTPLAKWAAAIELLASTNGVNAKQLADLIGVKHKTAWLMLRKFRQAIGEVEDAFKLQGTVHTGLHFLAPNYIFIFLPHRHYRCERVVSISASVGRDGKPTALKLGYVPRDRLVRGFKEPTAYGKERILEEHVDPSADKHWLNSDRMHHSPLRDCLLEARGWMNRLFNGVGTKYLQSYLNEFCFRWNAGASGASLRDSWYGLTICPEQKISG